MFNYQSREFVSVNILNDTLFEDPETFFGRLSAAGVLPPNVRLTPIQATATIIDDEGIFVVNKVRLKHGLMCVSGHLSMGGVHALMSKKHTALTYLKYVTIASFDPRQL